MSGLYFTTYQYGSAPIPNPPQKPRGHADVGPRNRLPNLARESAFGKWLVVRQSGQLDQCTRKAVAAMPTPISAEIVPVSQNEERFVRMATEQSTNPNSTPNSPRSKRSARWCACWLSSILVSASLT